MIMHGTTNVILRDNLCLLVELNKFRLLRAHLLLVENLPNDLMSMLSLLFPNLFCTMLNVEYYSAKELKNSGAQKRNRDYTFSLRSSVCYLNHLCIHKRICICDIVLCAVSNVHSIRFRRGRFVPLTKFKCTKIRIIIEWNDR